jgi:hypothetical protein
VGLVVGIVRAQWGGWRRIVLPKISDPCWQSILLRLRPMTLPHTAIFCLVKVSVTKIARVKLSSVATGARMRQLPM